VNGRIWAERKRSRAWTHANTSMSRDCPGLMGCIGPLLRSEQNTKLYRSYCQIGAAAAVTRHRGKSPRQAAFFFRNPEVTFHAAQLASLYLIYGLVRATARGPEACYCVGSLESGTLLCQAYEAYLDLHAPVSISFEHAWFLLLALARHDEVGIVRCETCGGVQVRDLLARHKPVCGNCRRELPGLTY
jgi:hypothetical protein